MERKSVSQPENGCVTSLMCHSMVHSVGRGVLGNSCTGVGLPSRHDLDDSCKIDHDSVGQTLKVLTRRNVVFGGHNSKAFVGPLCLGGRTVFHCRNDGLKVASDFGLSNGGRNVGLLGCRIIPTDRRVRRSLFLGSGSFICRVGQLHLVSSRPFVVRANCVPVGVVPALSPTVIRKSVFGCLRRSRGGAIAHSFVAVSISPSGSRSRGRLRLGPARPINVVRNIFFLSSKAPFRISGVHIRCRCVGCGAFIGLGRS